MAITPVNPTVPVIAAPNVGGASDGVVLQPGTVVPAQVESVLADNLVRIAIANLSIDVLTEVALTPGQNLQLAVSQPQDGVVRLQIVGQGTAAAGASTGTTTNDAASVAPNAPVSPAATIAAANDPLTPLERIAVSVASENAATAQQSLAPLFANLNAAASSNGLPPALQQAIASVLVQQTPLDETLSGGDIQSAFQKSGLFLEASLASGAIASNGTVPDLKAALIVLRQTLASAVEGQNAVTSPSASAPANVTKPNVASPPLAPSLPAEMDRHETVSQLRLPLPNVAAAADPDKLLLAQALLSSPVRSVTSGAALNLLQEVLQEMPPTAASPAAIITSPNGQIGQNGQGAASPNAPTASTPPPPFRGALPSAQPVATSSIAPNAPLSTTVHHLLDDTDAALARQTLLQVASLPDRVDASGNRIDPSIPRWNFEIPFATPQGTAMAQFEISRDGGGEAVEPAKRTWQARFSLNVEPAGPVHALISLTGDRTSVRMWAERPQTAARLRAGASELSQALSKAELSPGDIVIRDGAPPQVVPARAGHFLDRAL
ncbi:MAG TPA: flagellar hook-length control protein FliK [Bradyrhizobium sp.]|uniref:flagellar hook-length control protein FliK n=1 Tax=Bradyrhizobium sp. TaxID=376 RepID=UPI002C3EE096|nr:flagellar hook-length control protein FliK [Bradyrhizobium sp.]HLZ00838.1 flagellar hook-length control protein FliK [Bradyrhizobium sp.]